MTTPSDRPDRPHPAAELYAREYRAGLMDRREFLGRATALGLSAGAAYGLIGRAAPARAQPAPRRGGTLRIQMDCRELSDPRTYDWSEKANESRGIVEYLAELKRDGTLRPMLLEGWQANGDATEYTLRLRPGVTWNTGEAFTAEDVAANLAGWCDSSVEGNSMPSRMAAMVENGQAAEGAIEIVDDLTVRLHLLRPDGTLMFGMTDYPAAVMHRDRIGTSVADHGIGTGAYMFEEFSVGERIVLVRNPEHSYWGDGAWLDRIEFLDYGTDPAAWLAGADAGEFDMTYETVSDFIDIFTALGWVESTVGTSSTVVIRANQEAEIEGIRPYADPRVRRALALAVDNAVPLELGISGRGRESRNNFHVAPGVHPDYAEIAPHRQDIPEALRLMREAGMMEYEHELISIDDDYRKNTTDAVAAQLRDAGFKVRRTVLPGSTFWNDWTRYPFSSTNWSHRETGIQMLNLAYRSTAAWNETGFRNAEFDALLDQATAIADDTARREVMARLEQMMVDDGVAIIPYFRSLYRHAREGVLNAGMHPKYEINVHHLGWA
ncbi:ABC transporter substrate-binding protein [Rhodovulum sulfidophilum]|uniref:ABC transporter substrate-binding protein n=1 Tax=Rhodovulum sulfidophilum TaxID=35806 RepID=UPI0009522D7A|nr:ABC transporter substrate-binding protein [Rhodovulum sulfidophilum]MBL3550747.1 ABC transporter substrate-binding protein [Rhodovulum sulfidophilum]OLS48585.1 diguanylate cyclase [Rhodovulum sulfidophilum]